MTLDYGPFVDVTVKYLVLPVVGTVLTGIASWAIIQVNRLTGLKIADANWKVIHSAAQAAANEIWAAESPQFAHATITVDNPVIAAAAQKALGRIPDLTPELQKAGQAADAAMSDLIVQRLGAMQASASAPIILGAAVPLETPK